MIVDDSGTVWFTQGGANYLADTTPYANQSDVVAYNPSNKTSCSYILPPGAGQLPNNQVVGIAATYPGGVETIAITEGWGTAGGWWRCLR